MQLADSHVKQPIQPGADAALASKSPLVESSSEPGCEGLRGASAAAQVVAEAVVAAAAGHQGMTAHHVVGKAQASVDRGQSLVKPGLWGLIREDFVANDRDWTKPGFRALAVHRFGNWRLGIRHKLVRAPLSVLYRSMFRYVRNHYGIELPFTVVVGRRVVIEHQGDIVVHGNSVIGDGCILRQGVTLGNKNLEAPFDAPVLGNYVNVGAGAKILGKVTVGDGAQIGANAVIIRSVPPGAVAVGNPARIVRNNKPGVVP